ncbi:MAG TPA: nucleotidyltransferase family protein [Acidimicrobiales bacterium]|nr:nucleotidyltransferase family protein [Acidimicrobiales bacterium]
MTVAAVVLAAGASSRFAGGAHKLATPFRGKPLVCWAVEAAGAAGLDEILVVEGRTALRDLLPGHVTVVGNPLWADGLATSLRAGLDAAAASGHEAVVVGLGDQPLVPATAWRAVADAGERPIAVATYGGKRRNPVRLHRSVWHLVPSTGDAGARALYREFPHLVGEVACDGEPADIDTVEDLARWS